MANTGKEPQGLKWSFKCLLILFTIVFGKSRTDLIHKLLTAVNRFENELPTEIMQLLAARIEYMYFRIFALKKYELSGKSHADHCLLFLCVDQMQKLLRQHGKSDLAKSDRFCFDRIRGAFQKNIVFSLLGFKKVTTTFDGHKPIMERMMAEVQAFEGTLPSNVLRDVKPRDFRENGHPYTSNKGGSAYLEHMSKGFKDYLKCSLRLFTDVAEASAEHSVDPEPPLENVNSRKRPLTREIKHPKNPDGNLYPHQRATVRTLLQLLTEFTTLCGKYSNRMTPSFTQAELFKVVDAARTHLRAISSSLAVCCANVPDSALSTAVTDIEILFILFDKFCKSFTAVRSMLMSMGNGLEAEGELEIDVFAAYEEVMKNKTVLAVDSLAHCFKTTPILLNQLSDWAFGKLDKDSAKTILAFVRVSAANPMVDFAQLLEETLDIYEKSKEGAKNFAGGSQKQAVLLTFGRLNETVA
ncbi:MAG: hypothetical protein AAF364_16710 [Pseudomonadota bacterium]